MIGDEYELYALARGADRHGIPEAAAAVLRKLLQRYPQSPLAAHAIFYLRTATSFPPPIERQHGNSPS